jgi:hypothetical protein
MSEVDEIQAASTSTQAIQADNTAMPAPPHNDSESTLQGIAEQEDDMMHEAVQERYQNPSSYRFRRIASKTLVSFGPGDPEDPVNWGKVGDTISK